MSLALIVISLPIAFGSSTPTAGYVRIKGMWHGPLSYVFKGYMEKERTIIREFLEREQGKYQKLIIDIRNNGGGTPEYVYESLLCPFLDGPVTFRQVAGLRKKYLQDTKQSVLQDLKKQYALYVIETRELKPPNGFAENDWVFYEITRQIRPSQRYSFQGKIYVLINGGCWSAADDYADLVKRTGLGTLAGQNTGGGGGHEDGPDQQQDQERLTRLADDRWPHTDAVPPPRPGFAVFPSDRVRVVSA